MRSIFEYHLGTSHARTTITGRSINWGDQPVPFKLYRNLPVFHLPQQFQLPDIALDKAMASRPLPDTPMAETLAGVCNLATGITKVKKHSPGTVFHFRSMASAGALYPTELYVALQNISGMNDGLYHYSPLEHTLTHLKVGQVFSALAGSEPIIRFYLTSIYHRSAWKYGPRAYRYCLLDAGHVAENLLMAARMHGLPAQLDYDFDDAAINDFLCLDPTLEGCLAQVHGLGCNPETPIYDTDPPNADLAAFSRSAAKATTPLEVLDAHRISSASSRTAHVAAANIPDATPLPNPIIPASASATIQRRRSKRNFVTRDAPTRDLADILGILCRDDYIRPECGSAIQTGFLANDNSGLTLGYHRLDRSSCSTFLIKPGKFMAQAGRICLDQGWLENAAMHLIFTADIQALESAWGPRTYRYAHLEAGRLGQRAYLAATAKNMGVCGIGAFFDQEAATLLDLPEGHALLYLVAIGPVKN